MIVVGVLALLWALVVWRWGDPVTALYTRHEQHQLRREYNEQTRPYPPFGLRLAAQGTHVDHPPPRARVLRWIRREAVRYRSRLRPGDPVGILVVPRMGLHAVVIDGTDHESLKRGPGRDPQTYVPGQHELVYIAGHRTTYGAPFAHIDNLRPGDTIRFDVPYGVFTYVVTGHRIVAAGALGVLRSNGVEQLALQACHPRFFATQRYIADARLVRVAVRNGRGGWDSYELARPSPVS